MIERQCSSSSVRRDMTMHHFSSQHTNYCEKSDLEHCPSSAKRSKLNEDTPRNDKEIRNVKIAAKKVRQKLNQTKRKELKIIYKKMINNLKEGGYFEEENMKTKKQLPENPSYSMIYSFSGGLNIVMYNATYALKNIKDIIHNDCGVVVMPYVVIVTLKYCLKIPTILMKEGEKEEPVIEFIRGL